jgi:hypothetical protein
LSDTEKRKSAFVEALELRAANRDVKFIDASEFCGPESPLAGKRVALRWALKAEELAAIVKSERQAKRDGGEVTIVDRDYVVDNKTLHILCEVVRSGDNEEDARVFPAFHSPSDIARLMHGDEIACLLNIYNALALEKTPMQIKVDPSTVDAHVEILAELASSQAASAALARCDRVWLEQFAQIVCVELRQARRELAAHVREREIAKEVANMQFVPIADAEPDDE